MREGPVYGPGAWTVLKLLAVQYTVDFCLKIMAAPNRESGKPRQGFGSVAYIDLNAGSGLVRPKGTKSILAGTGLIGPALSRDNPGRAFDMHFLVEPDPGLAQALEVRVGALIPKDRFRVIQRGADEAVGEILDIVRSGNANFVAVFDPFGFNEGSEESWARLLRERDHGDLIATFQTKMAVRHTAKSIAPLVGPSVLDGHEDEHLTTEAALKAFTESVGRYRRVVQAVRIRAGDQAYFYDLVYATRLSRTGGQWADAFGRVKARLEALDGATMKTMLNYRTLERGLDAVAEPETAPTPDPSGSDHLS